MTGKLRVAILVVVAAGSAFLLLPVTALEFANGDRGTVTRIRIGRDGRFSVTYRHSVYDAPVTEEFSVDRGRGLVLTAVRSRSGAVLEYFGFEDARERHPMARTMEAIVFRVATGAPQELESGGRRVSFLSLGAPGDRVTARAVRAPLWRFFLGAGGAFR